MVALDGEVSNSTFSEIFREAHPDRYFECFIAEQQMIATAVGIQVRGWVPYASTFAAFLARAYDFVRMAAVSRARLNLVGSHVGCPSARTARRRWAWRTSPRSGPSTAAPSSTRATPTRRPSWWRPWPTCDGIVYLRTTRANTAVIYGPDEEFPVGGSKVVRSSDADQVTIVGGGITLHEALKAADALAAEGVAVRVIDAYSVKPIDAAGIAAAVQATGRQDRRGRGPLARGRHRRRRRRRPGRGRPTAVSIVRLAVSGMPTSGKPDELLAAAGIDADAIADAVRGLLKSVRSRTGDGPAPGAGTVTGSGRTVPARRAGGQGSLAGMLPDDVAGVLVG